MTTHVHPPSPSRHLPALAGWVLFTFAFAAIGAFATSQAGSFYQQLDRPDWAPPGWLFGPVWTMLYALMAIAAWRVQRSAADPANVTGARPALALYVVQLVLNALWSWLFFAWHHGALAFAEIIVLWLAIVATVAAFGRRDRIAALLLVPYLGWVSFAGVLCYTVWQRNPAVLG
ncbi:sensory protein [Duganella sp. Leaf126]|uniref:TspO/MBR family protein n=1 Tax=Duganella sp. Leaf126 TaxID=1736266 RepID=UPI0006F3F21E|nr:TspO/MBR family protein [Duganella sp. Leaf126]KQQ32436.1 sensory protein [Duganella sp. Leaf126]